MAKLIRVGEPPQSWRSHAFTLAWKWGRFGFWTLAGGGWRVEEGTACRFNDCVSSGLISITWLMGFSITGFLIKKFPARKIKLNRQYKCNQKSIVQLTFLLCVIERLDFGLLSFAYGHAHAQSSWAWMGWVWGTVKAGSSLQNYVSKKNSTSHKVNPIPAGQDAGAATSLWLNWLVCFWCAHKRCDVGSGIPNSLFKSASLLWLLLGG